MIHANMYFYVHDGPKTPCSNGVIILHVVVRACTYVHVAARIYVQIRAMRAKI